MNQAMKNKTGHAWKLAAVCAAVVAMSGGAMADAYPSKPVRFVVGFPAGSSIDLVSRTVIEDIRERTGANIVIDNKAGALGSLGLSEVVRAAPDGYTLMPSSSATHSSGPYLSNALEKLKPQTATSPVGRLVQFNIAVATRSAGPLKSAKDLVATAKDKPESLTFGFGSGTGQVGGAAFGKAAGLSARPIPYKGQPPAITDLLGGQVDFVAADIGAFLPFFKQGTLTPIALLADKRSAVLPQVPTAAELGYPDVVLMGWIGVSGPAQLPEAVTQWWTGQIKTSMASPKVHEKLLGIGMEPAPMYGAEFSKFVADQYQVWGKHVLAAGLKAE